MNKIFDIKRFGKYLVYDINNAKYNYGFSLLIMGLTPLIAMFFQELISLVSFGHVMEVSVVTKTASVMVALVGVVLSFPSKVYGGVTNKKYGSNWLMVPASSFEKWLSVVIVCCVILPLCLGILLFASDTLLSLVLPKVYGDPVIIKGLDFLNENLHQEYVDINYSPALYLNWCENILIFTLGAFIFKRSKAGKTILAMIIFVSLLAVASVTILPSMDIEELLKNVNDPQTAARWFNVVINTLYTLIFAALLGGLYYRIRTIKH